MATIMYLAMEEHFWIYKQSVGIILLEPKATFGKLHGISSTIGTSVNLIEL